MARVNFEIPTYCCFAEDLTGKREKDPRIFRISSSLPVDGEPVNCDLMGTFVRLSGYNAENALMQ